MNRLPGKPALALLVVGLLCCVSCSTRPQHADRSELDDRGVVQSFDVYWPPVDPAEDPPSDARSLLAGQLSILPDSANDSDPRLVIQLSLFRNDDQESRRFWNSSLEYREYAWMRRVRVWDADHQWLYPNLPFLYGDFMNHRVPDAWPAEPDSDGGSLAFFHVNWQYTPGEPIQLSIAQRVPEATGYDWRSWVGRQDEEAQPVGRARLETAPATGHRPR